MKKHRLLVLGTLIREARRGGEGGMETQAPEWAAPGLLQQLEKEAFSPPTAPSSQLHFLELKNHPPHPQMRHHAMG